MCIYITMCMYIYIYIHLYVHEERERVRERDVAYVRNIVRVFVCNIILLEDALHARHRDVLSAMSSGDGLSSDKAQGRE